VQPDGEDGDERILRSIEHAPVDADWNPDRSRTVREECDALLVGFGFVPRVQLAQMAGCELEWRPEVGGWTPVRDANLATSVDGVYAAGDGAGVAGALVAESEGRLAGLAAAHRLGALDARSFAALRAPIDATRCAGSRRSAARSTPSPCRAPASRGSPRRDPRLSLRGRRVPRRARSESAPAARPIAT
jgi:hypothetical protein